MAFKEKKLNKADIQAIYEGLGSDPEPEKKTGKGRKPGTAEKKETGKKKK